MIAHPPRPAQWLISILAPRATEDSILGDLLEEYRDTQVPTLGNAAANRWYVRQALGFLWPASAPAALALAGVLTIRMLIDVSAPSTDLAARAWLTTLAAMAIFLYRGFRLGRSTGRLAGACVAATAATLIASAAAYAAALLGLAIAENVVRAGPAVTAGFRESLDLPVHVIAALGVALSSAGAALGQGLGRFHRDRTRQA